MPVHASTVSTVVANFSPRLDILPAAQARLWSELAGTPSSFVLYGGTAIALRLGHRQSVDFDFFSGESFEPALLAASVPYLAGASIRQMRANTLTCSIDRGGPVLVSFFGGLSLGQVAEHETAQGSTVRVASLLDLSGTKVAVVTQRAEARDYADVHALLTLGGLKLPQMLAAARAIYADQFNPLIALKALSYHAEFTPAELPEGMRRDLIEAVKSVDVQRLPEVRAIRPFGARS
jgi:hypothetical protein